MRATDLLRTQHSDVKDCLGRIEQTPADQRGPLVSQLSTMLRSHNRIEEELFYPRFEELEGFQQIIRESFDEHARAVSVLGDLERCDTDSDDFTDLLDQVEQLVLDHVTTE